jgi:hypothetical protein
MKLSKETLEVLKNFENVNHSLCIDKGSTLKTISPLKNLLIKAGVEETFPVESNIFDLRHLNKLLKFYKDGDVNFKKNHLIVTSDLDVSRYDYCDPSLIMKPPEKDIDMSTAGGILFKCHIPEDVLVKAMKLAKINHSYDICIETNKIDNSVYFHLGNNHMGMKFREEVPVNPEIEQMPIVDRLTKCDSCGSNVINPNWKPNQKPQEPVETKLVKTNNLHPANTYTVQLPSGHSVKKGKDQKKITDNHRVFLKVDNINKLLNGSYDCEVANEIVYLQNTERPIECWVASEASSSYSIKEDTK